MSKRSNCKKPKCQNARTAKSPNVKTVELQKARMSKRSNCKKPERMVRPEKWHQDFCFGLGICFLHFCLKRIVLNFQPDRSHPRRVNDLPKNRKNPKTDTRKKKIELGILFLHFCLKRIVLNFQPNRSHSRDVNDLPKNCQNPKSGTHIFFVTSYFFEKV